MLYILKFFPDWNIYVYVILFMLIITGYLFIILFLDIKSRHKIILRYSLFVYLGIVYCVTVLGRSYYPGLYNVQDFCIPILSGIHYQLEPLWSYRWGIKVCGINIVIENLLNIAMFVPIGVLVHSGFVQCSKMKTIILIGFFISLSIELLQLITGTGLFEIDDLLHNTIGTVIGYWIYDLFLRIREKMNGEYINPDK